MKIFHLISTICRGGAETQLLTLVREQVEQKHDVSVFFLKGDPELLSEFLAAGAKVRFDLHDKNFFHQIWLFRNAVNFENCMIHAHLPKSELVASIAKSRNKLLISRHNAETFFPGSPSAVSKLLSKWVSWRSDGCICISQAVKNYLDTNGELISSRPVWIVHYGYNSTFRPVNRVAFFELEKAVTIGTVSRLVPQKDLPTLLKAFKQLLDRNVDSNLLIVGRGVERNKLKSFANDLNILDKIQWIEKTENVYSNLSTLNVFCLTSRYEGFGLVLLEAMQSRVPIVAAKNSAIVEVLGEQYPFLFETSNVVDLASKIERLLISSERQVALDYLEKRLSLFSPVTMEMKVTSVYEEIIKI
jgi:glycosyltransferase involved in cell wall biosynthesis